MSTPIFVEFAKGRTARRWTSPIEGLRGGAAALAHLPSSDFPARPQPSRSRRLTRMRLMMLIHINRLTL